MIERICLFTLALLITAVTAACSSKASKKIGLMCCSYHNEAGDNNLNGFNPGVYAGYGTDALTGGALLFKNSDSNIGGGPVLSSQKCFGQWCPGVFTGVLGNYERGRGPLKVLLTAGPSLMYKYRQFNITSGYVHGSAFDHHNALWFMGGYSWE